MITSTTNSSLNTSNIPTSTSNITATISNTESTINAIEQDDESISFGSSSYILDDNLRVRNNSVEIAFSEATKGTALSQIADKALDHQSKLLSNVSDKLKYILKNETTSESQESIRKDIYTLLEEFDAIAADSNYEELYALQKSNNDTNTSSSYSFRISELPPIVLSTESIQSNTEGLGLSDLKSLTEDELTVSVANEQSTIVTDALEVIENFQSDYQKLIDSFKTSTNSLSDLHKSFERSNEKTKEMNFQFESLVFDKNKILQEMGQFYKIQANASQSNVLSLLTSDSNSVNSFNTLSSDKE